MKFKLLNPQVSSEILSVKLITAPIHLFLNDKNILTEEGIGTQAYYSSMVFAKELREICVFEYGQSFLDAFLGYRRRSGGNNFSVLVQRNNVGKLILARGDDFELPEWANSHDILSLKTGLKNIYDKKSQLNYTPFELRG